MLHDVQGILGIGIDGSLPVEPSDCEWQHSLGGLFGEPFSELRAKGHFTSGSINVGALLQLCHRSQSMETQTTAYYMAIVGSTLLVDKTRVGMRLHPVVAVTADQHDISWGALTLAHMYRQLGMTWIYEYFPAFRTHPRQADMPNKTRAEMWSAGRRRSQSVEWTSYMNYDRHLLNEHPRTAFIGGITCFGIVEVYLPERTIRQFGCAQAIPPLR
ncbi:protein MAIN-LIKE 1-like [Amaranthus tricolor]|uniref:protein MAIN-LIKE 1-like n=1 Tax=Amaranthus tricolor TaxID=29722 RepID=UPI0025896F65|nr:protein MAIN-LIKE 1-like [Amaranthus tricolor]